MSEEETTPAAPAAEPEAIPAAASADPTPDANTADPTPPVENKDQEKEKRHNALQRRFDEMTRTRYQLEERNRMLESRLQEIESRLSGGNRSAPREETKPKVSDFDTQEEFFEALADWKATHKVREQVEAMKAENERNRQKSEQEQLMSGWQKRQAEARQKYEDYEESLAMANIPISPAVQQALLRSENGPDVAYYLSKHPEEAILIAGLEPFRAAVAIGRIEERIQSKTAPITKLPEPIRKPKASVPMDESPKDTDTPEEWARKRNAELRKRGMR
jgi:hypothetical protein